MSIATAGRFGLPGGYCSDRDYPNVFHQYVDAIKREFKLRCRELSHPIQTVYIGGGTPTALPATLLEELVEWIRDEVLLGMGWGSAFKMKDLDDVEITIEANPEDCTPARIESLRRCGVNRISIGVQSFDDNELQSAGRKGHRGADSVAALEALSASGINYSADLIYGLPGQCLKSWRIQLAKLLSYLPPHVSCYSLSYEPGTRLYAMREKGIVHEVDEALSCAMYEELCSQMSAAGYRHYEISNFALPGFHSRHNSSYWNLTPYLGLGCSAHSFDGVVRRYNPANLRQYLLQLAEGTSPAQVEIEDSVNAINDYLITALRTDVGLKLWEIERRWGKTYIDMVMRNAEGLIEKGLLVVVREDTADVINADLADNNDYTDESKYKDLMGSGSEDLRIVIPQEYWLRSDAILRDLILDH